MGIEITVRTNSSTSYFQNNLARLIKTPDTDTLLLSSGFFQKSIFDNSDLIDLINNHCSRLILIGAHTLERDLSDFTYKSYSYFASHLVYNTKNIAIETYMAKEKKWHGKVALKIKDNTPLVALTGSSNLTEPAYNKDYDDFNYETDVLIWDQEVDSTFGSTTTTEQQLEHEDIFPPMIAELRKGVVQKDETTRLLSLYNAITNGAILESVNFFTPEESCVIQSVKTLEKEHNLENFKDCGRSIAKYGAKLSFNCCKFVRDNYLNYFCNNIESIDFIPKTSKDKAIELLQKLNKELNY